MPPDAEGQPQLTPGGEVFIYWADELVVREEVEPGIEYDLIRLAGSTTYRVVFEGVDGVRHETMLRVE